jgi:hypothetical protein
MDPGNQAHSPGLGVEQRKADKPADVPGCLSPSHVKPDQAIGGVGPVRPIKIAVQGEQRGAGQATENRKQVFIRGAAGTHILADHPEVDSPLTQQLSLPGGQVFVEHQQGIP